MIYESVKVMRVREKTKKERTRFVIFFFLGAKTKREKKGEECERRDDEE
jgi:hypothetical protein